MPYEKKQTQDFLQHVKKENNTTGLASGTINEPSNQNENTRGSYHIKTHNQCILHFHPTLDLSFMKVLLDASIMRSALNERAWLLTKVLNYIPNVLATLFS